MRKFLNLLTPLIALAAMFCYQAALATTIDTVFVGNPGNVGDVQMNGTFGAVAHNYRIGTTEVTNAQYAEFLNAVPRPTLSSSTIR